MTDDVDHETLSVRAIRAAIARVPFYAKQGLAAPPESAPLAEVLAALPLLSREKVRATLPKAWLPEGLDAKAELASGALTVVDNGVGEARMRILFDAAWWRAQERRALALNPHARAALAGELGQYKEAVLWVPERGTGSCGAGDPELEDRLEGDRLHLNTRQDPTFWSETVMTRMLDELARHETTGLLADPFYLDELARHAGSLDRKLDVRGFVALTRARPTASHRDAIRRGTSRPVFDVFGAREAGVLYVEGEDGLLHHAPFAAHVELLPARVETPGAKEVALVVVTTVTREVQPLLRYVLGDLVQVAPRSDGAPRPSVPSLTSVEGKLDDAIIRPDGAIVTAGAIDRALAPLGLRAYQVVQREADAVDVDVSGDVDGARDLLAPHLVGMRVTARASTSLAVEPNGKYRSTKRLIPHPFATAFEGLS